MSKLNAYSIIGGNPENGRRASDFYPTPPAVTQAILEHIKIPDGGTIWEPAAGDGRMADQIRKNGFNVIETDIQTGTDFLTVHEFSQFDWIITNPPFSLADQFILHAVTFQRPFAFLLKVNYFSAKKRLNLFRKFPPSMVCPLTWRPHFLPDLPDKKSSPPMDVAWYVWIPGSRDCVFQPIGKPDILT